MLGIILSEIIFSWIFFISSYTRPKGFKMVIKNLNYYEFIIIKKLQRRSSFLSL